MAGPCTHSSKTKILIFFLQNLKVQTGSSNLAFFGFSEIVKITMAAPKLSSDWIKKAILARNLELSSDSEDTEPIKLLEKLSVNECKAIQVCYADHLKTFKAKSFFRSRSRHSLYSALGNVNALSMLELVRDALPNLDKLEMVFKNNKLNDENTDDYLSFVVNVNTSIEVCLTPTTLNWAKDRISQRANYVAVLLRSFYMLKGLALDVWYNRIMQFACFKATFLEIPPNFVIPSLMDSYELLDEKNNDRVKSLYMDAMVLLSSSQLRKSVAVKVVIRLLWKKSSDHVTGKDIEEVCEFPALISVLAETCNELPGGYVTQKKRGQQEDHEFDPKSVRVKRAKSDTTVKEITVPKLVMTKNIKNIQAFVDESVVAKTVYTESAIVANLMLSTTSFGTKDPLGMMVLISSKFPPTHFVNVPKLVTSFYKPHYSTPNLDRNTYCALFLGWFPVWLVITSHGVTVYMLSVHDYPILFDVEENKFVPESILAYEPDFNTCDVFEQKTFGVQFLSILIGRVAVIMCVLTGKHHADHVELIDKQVPVFRAGANKVIQTVFRNTASTVNHFCETIFRPLMAVCNLGKPESSRVELSRLKDYYISVMQELASTTLFSNDQLLIDNE